MDEKSIRKALGEISEELTQLDARRQALLDAHKGLEALLTLRAPETGTPTLLYKVSPANGGGPHPKGVKSLRSAVLQVVKDARGAPLHSEEILRRSRELGASTEAKDPKAVVDLVLYSLKKSGQTVEKVAPRTWRWTGE